MKVQSKWIIIFIVIFSVTTYWSLTYASHDTDGHLALVDRENNETENKNPVPVGEEEIDQDDNPVPSYLEELFFQNDVRIGSQKEELFSEMGVPLDEGMYNGGYYYSYDTLTYFVNPDTDQINAMAYPGEALDEVRWKAEEEVLEENLKFAGENEMDGIWMEIYDWNQYDVMIERIKAGDSPFYIWLMEDSLFLD
ncbi:hypothetical protein [Evansella tamaricis]|uniref:Uncharacterized protein n=1 Tax=Evansella tamaricis TaxID=2069301 RepID=A0ABS6J9A0_9BACI|nr:hypothetical protein [Evansella tamaricis]MBU9710263.1 hypothetical protein [Evansella tamaricis]